MTESFYKNSKCVATHISMKDFATLQHLAFVSNLTVATFLRSIITDAIQEEDFTSKLKSTNTSNHPPV
jgi:hypothetical protein